jgi:predicted nucleic acid-binding protein
MLLVVDANVLISALIAAGKTADLLFCEQLQFIAPEFLFLEIEDHKGEIVAKSGLSDAEVDEFLSLLKAQIEVIPRQQFERYLQEANRISPDPDDTEYFALALRFGAILWSNDKELKEKQSKVTVLSTAEVLALIS